MRLSWWPTGRRHRAARLLINHVAAMAEEKGSSRGNVPDAAAEDPPEPPLSPEEELVSAQIVPPEPLPAAANANAANANAANANANAANAAAPAQ